MSTTSMQRNVTVLSGESGELLAGFWQRNTITIEMFYTMLQFIITVDPEDSAVNVEDVRWALYNECGQRLEPSDASVLPVGTYYINRWDGGPCAVRVTSEHFRRRTRSVDSTGMSPSIHGEESFKDRVRARDGRCLVTGHAVEDFDYAGFVAAHIFPIAHEASWKALGFAEQVQDDHPSAGASKINSVQNGILLCVDAAALWDAYAFTIHPDTHKVLYFSRSAIRGVPEGTTVLFDHCDSPGARPLDTLLREHWRQCILARVKADGARAADFDFEFGPGDVDLQDEERWGGGVGQEMLEIELHRRLAPGS
ncbi:hypothetical protein BOTBODRAFT_174491 [Botryobasidium botryosum FD-172 SS1]|uniref:HNH nuclease domain-containing protein n=1 Tax=Botryobasidium botryosum (strain FD-172 SS1) TaxID=930990 RepID=A0A067MFM8_BOTB1|nr:hypothetical protein BOTBODRAFT_174491 [Botryobasidium botryosum FD-172 SS1]